MAFMVNPELLKMMLEKIAVVPSDMAMMAGGDPGAAPPMGGEAPDPSQLGVQSPMPPVDPATAAMGAAPPPGTDPTGAAAMAAPPAPLPPAQPAAPAGGAGAGQGQKLKPEQMMQMLDFRMYNMQQILTAIANALGVQIDPSVLVMPPGTTGAPPAELALPGGPMAPQPQQDPNAPVGPQPPGGPLPPGGPMDPSQVPVDPAAAKQAWWTVPADKFVVWRNANEPTPTQLKAAALNAIFRSRAE
jgi:translation initiation factor IF-2